MFYSFIELPDFFVVVLLFIVLFSILFMLLFFVWCRHQYLCLNSRDSYRMWCISYLLVFNFVRHFYVILYCKVLISINTSG